MTTTDIRKGDLVKATLKIQPENYAVFRAVYVGGYSIESAKNAFDLDEHDFEVLERPIEEALLEGAIAAYQSKAKEALGDVVYVRDSAYYEDNVKAVIEFVRQYEKEHSR